MGQRRGDCWRGKRLPGRRRHSGGGSPRLRQHSVLLPPPPLPAAPAPIPQPAADLVNQLLADARDPLRSHRDTRPSWYKPAHPHAPTLPPPFATSAGANSHRRPHRQEPWLQRGIELLHGCGRGRAVFQMTGCQAERYASAAHPNLSMKERAANGTARCYRPLAASVSAPHRGGLLGRCGHHSPASRHAHTRM